MPNWHDLHTQIQNEIQQGRLISATVYDRIRRVWLKKLHDHTGRNVILYYSGWLQKSDLLRSHGREFSIHDGDKNGFMAVIHKMDRTKGLDLVLHTPGGDLAATESLVDYLHAKFDDIRVVVPQIAMSAGSMIACAGNRIVMGDQSSLGPIDPQIDGRAALGVLEEFQQAAEEIRADPSRIPLWQPIIAKYNPTLIGECLKASVWSQQIVKAWLLARMFKGVKNARAITSKIVRELGSHEKTKAHNRHISKARAIQVGLIVDSLEADPVLQDTVLTLHHACVHSLTSTPTIKIIENQLGVAFIEQVNLPSGG
jgi:hypothetical protein